jgi:acyl-CoA synthetase (AMP-forming)/AMP-acid ligase II
MTGRAASIPATLRAIAARHAAREAIVDGKVRLTYAELDCGVIDACRGLIAMGVQPGDRVAIWAQNCWQWCVASLGISAAGAVIVPINTRFRGQEAARLVRDSGAVTLFTTVGFLGADYPDMLRQAAPSCGDLPTVVMTGDAAGKDLTWESFLGGGETVAETEALERIDAVKTEDICDIMYTSGTTGISKGVVQTHGKNLLAMGSFAQALGLSPEDRNLVLAPLFAQFGLRGGLYMDVMTGATTILDSVFDPKRIFDVIERERITTLPGPPTIMSALLSPNAAGRDLSSLRIAIMGSTVIPEDIVLGLLDNNVFDHVVTAYGLTEACGPVSVSALQDVPAQIASFAGRVLKHLEIRVTAPDGNPVAPGERGELLVRGATVMNGYLNDPELTAATIDEDGWLHTGDIGLVNSQGYVQITGRLKDMFIVGGFNVYPAEVETAIREHESVRDVALIGIPDERLGEVGAAFIVCEPGHELDPQALTGWCRGVLANYKVPRVFVQLDELPLNSSLKVDKLVLRRRLIVRPLP